MDFELNKQFEELLNQVEQIKKIRLILLEDKSEHCITCDLTYIPTTKYTYKGETLCPCCDIDRIDAYKNRLEGYNKNIA